MSTQEFSIPGRFAQFSSLGRSSSFFQRHSYEAISNSAKGFWSTPAPFLANSYAHMAWNSEYLDFIEEAYSVC